MQKQLFRAQLIQGGGATLSVLVMSQTYNPVFDQSYKTCRFLKFIHTARKRSATERVLTDQS